MVKKTRRCLGQTLKDQYRFAFLNTVRGDWQELSLAEVMGRAKAIYPAFHSSLTGSGRAVSGPAVPLR